MPRLPRLLAFAAIAAFALALPACSPTAGLAPGLTARMDSAGAQLDTKTAFGLINHLRAARGAPALTMDPALEAKARAVADAYAQSGKSPAPPEGVGAMLTSAGYVNFAETFSGWRGSDKDTATLSNPAMRRAGLAVTYSGASEYGAHWVLLLAP